jgi:hypothetical protein
LIQVYRVGVLRALAKLFEGIVEALKGKFRGQKLTFQALRFKIAVARSKFGA